MVAAKDPWFFPITGAVVWVSYAILALVLPRWWTATDYCSGDPTTYCSGVPPLMLAFVAVFVLGAVAWGYYDGSE